MKISHPGQQFQVPYPVGIQVKGYFNLWHLRNLVAGMMWILVSGSNNEWLTSYHWWLTTLQVRESRFLGYHQKKWDPYFESANAHLPQSLPILFHSSYPLESFTSNPPPPLFPSQTTLRYVQDPPTPRGAGGIPSKLKEPSKRLSLPGRYPRYAWKWCSKFPFPVWVGYGIVPLEGIYSLNKSWSFSCCPPFLQWQFRKSPPGQSAWSCCVHPRRPRCEALYETIQPNSCTPWLTVRSWKLMLGRKFTFWEKEIVSDAMLGSGVLFFCCWGLESLGCSATWGDSVG